MRRIPLIQIIGVKHGRLTPFMEVKAKGKYRAFNCLCECGANHVMTLNSLRNSRSNSCGCLKRELLVEKKTTHGLRQTRLYGVWLNIKNRCLNARCAKYIYYGGRGITISDDWKDSPELFCEYVDKELGERPTAKHSLDRIDNYKGYEAGNLRWATPSQQCNNTRRNVRELTMNNKTQTVKEWSEELNVSSFTIYKRIARGWIDRDVLVGRVAK